VLLGVFPPVDVSQSSALKLDSVLVPDPFCRPRAVLLLNIMGVDSELLSEWTAQEILGKSLFQQRPLSTVDSQLFELSGKDVRLDDLLGSFDLDMTDASLQHAIKDLTLLLGALYVPEGASAAGTLSMPLTSDNSIALDLSKDADRTFAMELVALVRGMQHAVAERKELGHVSDRPAQLFTGMITGIEALHKQYGSGAHTQQACKLVLLAANKVLESLQTAYGGEIVGVFTFVKETTDHGSPFQIAVSSRSARILQAAAPTADNSTLTPEDEANQLAGRAIVFFTVVILIISVILASFCLFSMPITRDTLLYSGVKLD